MVAVIGGLRDVLMQIILYLSAQAVSSVTGVQVNGEDVLFVSEGDAYRTWIRLINLHYTARTTVMVRVWLDSVLTTDQLCSAKASTSLLCEYSLRGSMNVGPKGSDIFGCCPHGYTTALTMGCPA